MSRGGRGRHGRGRVPGARRRRRLGVTGVAGPAEQEGQPVGTVFLGSCIDGEADADATPPARRPRAGAPVRLHLAARPAAASACSSGALTGRVEPVALFVAVRPPDEVLDRIAALPRPDRARRALVPPRAVARHAAVPRARSDDVDAVRPVAAQAPLASGRRGAARARGQPLRARRAAHPGGGARRRWPPRWPARTAGMGEPPQDRPFAGHLTLARRAVAPAASTVRR